MSRILIAVTLNTGRETLLVPFAFSLFEAIRELDPSEHVDFHAFGGLSIDLVRTQAALFAVKQHYDALIFVDDDQTFPKDAFVKLVKHWHADLAPVISGVYHSKAPPYHAFIYELGDKNWKTTYDPTKTYEVKAIATGCLLIDVKVFQSIPRPWFVLRRDLNGYLTQTEDCYFGALCHRAKIKMVVDASILCGHLRLVQFPQFFDHPMQHYDGEFLPKKENHDNMAEHKGPIIIHPLEGSKVSDGMDECAHIHQYPVPVNTGETPLYQCLDCGLVTCGEQFAGINVVTPYCCNPKDLKQLVEDLDHAD